MSHLSGLVQGARQRFSRYIHSRNNGKTNNYKMISILLSLQWIQCFLDEIIFDWHCELSVMCPVEDKYCWFIMFAGVLAWLVRDLIIESTTSASSIYKRVFVTPERMLFTPLAAWLRTRVAGFAKHNKHKVRFTCFSAAGAVFNQPTLPSSFPCGSPSWGS